MSYQVLSNLFILKQFIENLLFLPGMVRNGIVIAY